MQSMKLSTVQRQNQTLSPRLQHAVRLLQMSTLDFRRELLEVLSKNPFLETEEEASAAAEAAVASGVVADAFSEPGPAEHAAPALGLAAAGESNEGEGEVLSQPEASGDPPDDERDPWLADAAATASRSDGNDESNPPTDTAHAVISLSAHLHDQVNLLHLSERDRMLVKVLVESLDDDGYLRASFEELLPMFEADMAVTADELRVALCWLQACEPEGVAARSVQECLLLQLAAGVSPPAAGQDSHRATHALAVEIVTHHLDALADKDLAGLAGRLSCTQQTAQAACELIRRLDPHPGWRFTSGCIHYIVPDLTVRRVRGEWTVELNGAIVPRLRLNRVYAELFQRHRRAQDGEMAAHLQEARWTLRNVEQRFATILDVAQTIVRRQNRFFDHGVLAMKPLGLKEIAKETGLHESTVSRVTNNKYIATPLGVFELKYFFSRTMNTASGGACSAAAIRGLMKEMIKAEVPSKPLSDAEIARRLGRQGLMVARRTITKYRQHMRIEAVERRRQLV